MPSSEVTKSLAGVREATERHGFDGLDVTHYDNTPPGHVVLFDDHGRLARGEGAEIRRIIDAADDLDGLWSDLDRAELTRASLARRS